MTELRNTESVWRNPIHFLAFGFGSGTSPFAPGTCGTAVAIPLYLLIRDLPVSLYMIILAVVILAGIWICEITESALGVHDYSGIVWDEIAGYFLTMLFAPHHWWWVFAGFFLFRLFDIWKPWPVSWIDRYVGGGLGVMVDDLAAAFYAFLAMQCFIYMFIHMHK